MLIVNWFVLMQPGNMCKKIINLDNIKYMWSESGLLEVIRKKIVEMK